MNGISGMTAQGGGLMSLTSEGQEFLETDTMEVLGKSATPQLQPKRC